MSEYVERYWRDAVPADAIKEPPMVARFLSGKSDWFIGKLCGCWRDLHGDNPKWGDGSGLCHTACQVYDAPDPGEGWRLIDVEKETPKEGDQYLVHPDQWKDRADCHGCFKDDKFYRRRIEQPKPNPKYVPFTWEDREQLRGRWLQRKTDSIPIEQIATKFENGRRGLVVNGIYGADLLMKQWTFLDTGEPVGRKVQ